ncbi:MAG TPA: FecR domain-containing protein [Prolixibacteraceae bacterium]|nr:FecR domain-containing protein [Prolixibacteraceae bacterium]
MRFIIKKYLSGNSSEKEQKTLLDWMRHEDHRAEFEAVKNEWQQEVIHQAIPMQYEQSWNNIQVAILGNTQVSLQRAQRTLYLFRIAAILVVLLLIPSLVFFYTQKKEDTPLTYTTVTADLGQISKVLLPDSSVIWINSGSTIKYNNRFSASNRDIDLVGEAFFKVHKNKELPLIVNSQDLNVKVLGTEFCVSSYPEENTIHVILEKGKVELSSDINDDFRQEMKPGEMAIYNKEKKSLSLSTVNTGLYTSWKDGMINIYNLPLSELVIKLERRYNQKFIVDEAIKNLPYTFTIKNEDLHSVLRLMEKITPVDAIQKGNIIELRYNKSKN